MIAAAYLSETYICDREWPPLIQQKIIENVVATKVKARSKNRYSYIHSNTFKDRHGPHMKNSQKGIKRYQWNNILSFVGMGGAIKDREKLSSCPVRATMCLWF